jgi:hypothetical protein
LTEAEAEFAATSELLTRIKELNADLARAAAHIGVGFVPFAGDGLDYCEVMTGREFCADNGRELTREERVYTAAGLGIGSGAFWRGVGMVATPIVGAVVTPLVTILRDQRALVQHLAATNLRHYRGIRAAVGQFDHPFESVVANYLTSIGRTHFLVGDDAVESALKLVKGDHPVDFINLTSDGRVVMSEVKTIDSPTGELRVGDAIEQFKSTLAALKRESATAPEIAAFEVVCPAGTKNSIKGDFGVKGPLNEVIRVSTGEVIKIDGVAVRMVEVANP